MNVCSSTSTYKVWRGSIDILWWSEAAEIASRSEESVCGTPMARYIQLQCVRKRHVHVHGYVYSLLLEELSVCKLYMYGWSQSFSFFSPRSYSFSQRQRSVSGADARSRVSPVDFFYAGAWLSKGRRGRPSRWEYFTSVSRDLQVPTNSYYFLVPHSTCENYR